jgi:hypothetical protein
MCVVSSHPDQENRFWSVFAVENVFDGGRIEDILSRSAPLIVGFFPNR